MSPQTETKTGAGFKAGVKDYSRVAIFQGYYLYFIYYISRAMFTKKSILRVI